MQTVKISDCGDTIRVCYYTRGSRWDSAAARQVKRQWKQKAWKAMNFRNCREKLAERISCNFTYDDWHAVFSLDDRYNTTDYEVLRGYWRSSLRRLKRMARERGGSSPTYIYVCEGLHGDERLHIHALIKQDCPMDEIIACWPYGQERDVERLKNCEHRDHMARYLTKEPYKFGRDRNDRNLFVASHNCVKPLCHSYMIPDGQEIACPEGFQTVSTTEEINEFGRFVYKIYKRYHSWNLQ